MKQVSLAILATGALLAALATSALGQPAPTPDLPAWLYPPPPADGPAQASPAQEAPRFGPVDPHPGNHPPAPEVVAHGQKPEVWACGFCHLMNGQGHPENAPIAGLDVDYFKRAMGDFKSGARKSSDPHPSRMVKIAQAMTDDQVAAAAEYFASVKYRPWVEVKEVDVAPVYRQAGMTLVATGQTAPLGQQILEVPADPKLAASRDDESGFIAYVPKGSIAAGQALASGQGGVRGCTGCHGADLEGTQRGPVLAGRSPSYIVRQLYDFKTGARGGVRSQQMARIVGSLSLDQMIALAAYSASLKP